MKSFLCRVIFVVSLLHCLINFQSKVKKTPRNNNPNTAFILYYKQPRMRSYQRRKSCLFYQKATLLPFVVHIVHTQYTIWETTNNWISYEFLLLFIIGYQVCVFGLPLKLHFRTSFNRCTCLHSMRSYFQQSFFALLHTLAPNFSLCRAKIGAGIPLSKKWGNFCYLPSLA